MSDITLNDQERAALRALHEAGGEMAIADLQKDLRNAYVDLDVKGLVHMTSKRKGELSAELTDKGRALAADLFTPPLVFPTSKEAVKAWLQARGLWAEGSKVRTDSNGSLRYVIVSPVVSVSRYHATSNRFVACIDGTVIDDAAAEAQFRADFDRACAIARALNANKGEE